MSTRISLDDVRSLLPAVARGEVVLLDVRERAELAGGVLPAATWIPVGSIDASTTSSLAPDVRIVTYCAHGGRAARAASALAALGFARVEAAEPGFVRWKERGLPVTASPDATPSSALSPEARERYARHLLLPEVGEAGQARLLGARVLVVGAGGLGSPVALYLAAAGVGTLGIVDHDVVDLSNLQRQILHTTRAVGTSKVESAASSLAALAPGVAVELHRVKLTAENAAALVDAYDVVVDATDNFTARYALNDAAVARGRALVHGAVFRFEGQVSTFVPEGAAERHGLVRGPCYRCLFPEAPPAAHAPSCAEAGVLGVVPGVIGTLQATEVLKLLLGRGEPLVGRLLTFDALRARFLEHRFTADPACPACASSRDER